MKKLDLSKSVYELTEQYPELINTLKELGFHAITNPVARKTIGKMVTIPQGCKNQGKDLGEILEVLKKNGFSIK